MNRFEYCGSAWLHSINQQCLDRLEKCFAKSILRFLKKNIFSLTGKDEFTFLAKFNVFPLKYRLFFHFCTFSFNYLKITIFLLPKMIILLNIHTRQEKLIERITLKQTMGNTHS